jgi:Spy/CpxP family protein refolding chaperone
MKRYSLKGFGSMTVVILLFAFAVTAQAQMMGHEGMMGMPHKREGMPPMMGMPDYGGSPYGGGPFDTDMLREYLQLSEDQIKKFSRIRSDYRKEMIKRKANLRVAELELWELIDTKDLDMSKTEKKVKEIQAMEADLMLYRIRALEQTRKFLSDEQYERFREMGFKSMRYPMRRHGMTSGGMMRGMSPDYD